MTMVMLMLGLFLEQTGVKPEEFERVLNFDWTETSDGEHCHGSGVTLYVDRADPFGEFHTYNSECWDPERGIIYEVDVDAASGAIHFIGFEQSIPQGDDRPDPRALIRFEGRLEQDRICGRPSSARAHEEPAEEIRWFEDEPLCVEVHIGEMPRVSSRNEFLRNAENNIRYGLWWKKERDGRTPELLQRF